MIDPHAAHLRRGRVSEIGRTYLLTSVTEGRAPVFSRLDFVRSLVLCLRDCDALGLSCTQAFVVMPDHLHWLVTLQAGDLSGLMRRLKSASSRRVNLIGNTPGEHL